MDLRTHITRPRRFEDSPGPPGSSPNSMAPKVKLLPKNVRPAFKVPFVEYDGTLPPACFPTIADPVPKGEGWNGEKGKQKEAAVVIVGSEGEDGDDSEDEEQEENEIELAGVDDGEDIGEQDSGSSERNSEGVEGARDLGEVIEMDDKGGGAGEDADGRSTELAQESSHAVEETVKNLQGAVMALKDVAMAMSPERRGDVTDVDADRASSATHTLHEHGWEEDLDGGHNNPRDVDSGEAPRDVDVLVQGLQDAAQTAVMVEAENVPQVTKTSDIIGGVVNGETWTTLTPASTGLPGEREDANQNEMFQDAPTPSIEANGPIGWRDLNISIRLEILANALTERYDMKLLCEDLEIDEEAFVHSCVCLNERTKHLRHEDIVIDRANKEANEVLSTPGLIEHQYHQRHGKYPSAQQKSVFEQQQLHGHTLDTIDQCILRNRNTFQFEQFDQMFHCTKSDLRKAQKFLQSHNYDPRLAGVGWTGGERAVLETVLNMDGLSVSKKDIQKVKRVAKQIGVDLDLDEAPEMIDLLEGQFVSTGHYSRPLHLGTEEIQRANPLVRSGSSSSTDSEEERRVAKGKILRFKLPNSTWALLKLRDGARAVQTLYNLPDRYASGTRDGLQNLNPPRNLDYRPREFSPPRWHRSSSHTQGQTPGRSSTAREAFREGHSQPQSGDHLINEQAAPVSGVQGAGRGIKLKLRVPEGLLADLVGEAPTTGIPSAITTAHDLSTQVTAVAPATLPFSAAEVTSVVSTPATLVEQTEISTLNSPVSVKDGVRHKISKLKDVDFEGNTQAPQVRQFEAKQNPIPPTPEPLIARTPGFPVPDIPATPTGTEQDPPLSPATAQRAISSLLDKISTPDSRAMGSTGQLTHDSLGSFVNQLRRDSLDSQPKTPSTPVFESITPEKIFPPSPAYNSALLSETAVLDTVTRCGQSQAQITGEGPLITPVSAPTENPAQSLPIQTRDISTAIGLGIVLASLSDQAPTPIRATTPMSDTTTSGDFQTPRTGTTPYAKEKHDTIPVDTSEASQQIQQDKIPFSIMNEEREIVLIGVEDPHPPGRGKLPVQRQLERVRSQSTRRGKLALPAPGPPSRYSSWSATPTASKSELDVGNRATSISSFAPTDEDSSSANYMTEDDSAKPSNKKRKMVSAKKATKTKPAAPIKPIVYTTPQTRRSSSNLQPSEKPSEPFATKSPTKKATVPKSPQGKPTAAKKENLPPTARRRLTRTNTSTPTSTMPPSSAETTPTPLSIVEKLGATPRKSSSTTRTPRNTMSLGVNTADFPSGPSRPASDHKRRISLIIKQQAGSSDASSLSKKPRLKSPAPASPDPTSGDAASSSTIENQPGSQPQTRSSILAFSETMDDNSNPSGSPLDSGTQPLPTLSSSKPLPKSSKPIKNTILKPPPHTPLTRSAAKTPMYNLRSGSTGSTSAPPTQRIQRSRSSNVGVSASTKKENETPKSAQPKKSSDPNESPAPKKFGWGGLRIKGSGQGNHNKRK